MTAQHQSPCSTCPFARSTEPGTLGGSPVGTYVGQTEAGFLIYCHECLDYDDPDWKEKASKPGAMNQCAGAAIFRSNIERPKPAILTLPKDTEKVFASHAEFVAHHAKLSLAEAELLLEQCPPELFVDLEMRRAGVTLTLVPREPA